MSDLKNQVLEKIRHEFGNDVQIDFHDEKGDGKHFFVDIVSEKFIGKSKVAQSQMVYACLDEFMKTGYIHALRMKCRIPNT